MLFQCRRPSAFTRIYNASVTTKEPPGTFHYISEPQLFLPLGLKSLYIRVGDSCCVTSISVAIFKGNCYNLILYTCSVSDKNCTFSFFFQSSPYKSNEAVGRRRYLYLELALVSFALVPLEQHLTVRVRVDLHTQRSQPGKFLPTPPSHLSSGRGMG